MWDPRATHYRRADYAARMTLQPEEWVERNFPDTYHLVPKNYYNEAYSSDFFQLALMGMNGSRSSYGLTQMNLPKGKGLRADLRVLREAVPAISAGPVDRVCGNVWRSRRRPSLRHQRVWHDPGHPLRHDPGDRALLVRLHHAIPDGPADGSEPPRSPNLADCGSHVEPAACDSEQRSSERSSHRQDRWRRPLSARLGCSELHPASAVAGPGVPVA